MDKKNTTIGILLLLAAMGVLFVGQRFAPSAQPPPADTGQPPPAATDATAPLEPEAIRPAPAGTGTAATLPAAPETPETALFAAIAPPRRDGEERTMLANAFIAVEFTNMGGAIAEVALKEYPSEKNSTDPYVLNRRHARPALAIGGLAGADGAVPYRVVSQSMDSIVYQAEVVGMARITRSYALGQDPAKRDPYIIRHETRIENLTSQSIDIPNLSFDLGTTEPTGPNDSGLSLNVGVYGGDDPIFTGRDAFVPGFFAKTFRGDRTEKAVVALTQPAVWGSVKNQFFAFVLTPDEPGTGIVAQRVMFPLQAGETAARIGITGRMLVAGMRVEPGAVKVVGADLYAGPKEYGRLSRLGKREGLVMQFKQFITDGMFFTGFFAPLLLTVLKVLNGWFGNWGLAIVGTTLIIRTLMWPLTAAGARSAKRMAKIQGPMKELQEKYKDNRQKLNEEMLKLFKQHKVNPAGSCLPMFIQIPIFFGLFSMLRSASELRFAEFLWIGDLSAPDTVAHVFGFPLNIMPLLMGASMVVQMRMTPTPTTDNVSAKMMKFMPYMVTVMCYGFSSGLAVYWTASNLFSIFQQWVTNRQKDKPEAAAAAAPATPKLSRGLPVTKKKKK
jgi:YidC/Oxa1 family membrane protein insertase